MDNENEAKFLQIAAGLAHNQEIISKQLDDIQEALGYMMEAMSLLFDAEEEGDEDNEQTT